jgi:cell division protease FtsH
MDKKFFVHALEILLTLGTVYYIKNQALMEPASEVDLQAKVYHNDCSFQDFYGGELIKSKLRETIDFLRNPERFEVFGARIRRGVLLYGPPGTGKTLLARALANEAQCAFIKAAASEFQEIFAGVGAKRVRDLFAEARRHEQGCIIFIDEIDALGSRLNFLRDSHETTSTITQFLSEMDGFKPLDKVVVVASTNRLDLVDAAILRAGRFDIKVQVNLPCREERLGILKTLIAKKIKRAAIGEEALEEISGRLEGCSGADIEALLNEAVYRAIREDSR